MEGSRQGKEWRGLHDKEAGLFCCRILASSMALQYVAHSTSKQLHMEVGKSKPAFLTTTTGRHAAWQQVLAKHLRLYKPARPSRCSQVDMSHFGPWSHSWPGESQSWNQGHYRMDTELASHRQGRTTIHYDRQMLKTQSITVQQGASRVLRTTSFTRRIFESNRISMTLSNLSVRSWFVRSCKICRPKVRPVTPGDPCNLKYLNWWQYIRSTEVLASSACFRLDPWSIMRIRSWVVYCVIIFKV